MWDTIYTSKDLKLNPSIANALEKVVFFDEFGGYVGKVDAIIFGMNDRGVEIEFLYVVDGKLGTPARRDAFYHDFDKFE